MLKLVWPDPAYKDRILAYREEFLQNGDSMDGTAGLRAAESFEAWYAAWQDNRQEETVREGLVPATTFLAVDEDDRLIGMIDIRHRLNDYLLREGGHIGYSVRRSERRKGCATEMLRLALRECRRMGMTRVLVTCDRENIASARTIRNNGGVLENEVAPEGRVTQRYWIALT